MMCCLRLFLFSCGLLFFASCEKIGPPLPKDDAILDGPIPGLTPEQIPSGAPFSNFTPPANTGLGFIELVSDQDILAMSDPDDADGDGISGKPNWKPIPAYLDDLPNAIMQGENYICRFGKK